LGDKLVALAILPEGEVAMVLSDRTAPEGGRGKGAPPSVANKFYAGCPSLPKQGYTLHRRHSAKIHDAREKCLEILCPAES